MGLGIEDVFDAIIKKIPPPSADRNAPFRALLYDSWYDRYRGALCLIYIGDGSVNVGDNISFYHTKKTYEIKTLSVLKPHEESVDQL